MNEKVSIIVPLYNGEKYIKKLLSNIFSQTYSNIELILINDGSSDGTYDLVQKLIKKSPNTIKVILINQDNQGISKTRNNGLDEASGDYVVFIDQDDGINRDYIERLVEEIKKQQVDLLISGYTLVDSSGKVLDKWILNPDKEYSKYRIIAPWGRIFKKEIIDKYSIRFMDTKVSEDLYFNLVYMSFCEKIGVSSYCGYRWLFNESSESHSNWNKISEDRNPLLVLNQIKKDMNNDHCLNNDCLEYMQIKHIIWYLFYVAKSANKKELYKAYSTVFEWLKGNWPYYYKNKVMRHPVKYGDALKVGVIVFVSILLNRAKLLYPILRIYSKL